MEDRPMQTGTGLGVEEGSAILKRLYWAEREVMRALMGRHIWLSLWDAKRRTPRDAWEDSLHADALRSRVLELRYPKRDVDQDVDPGLAEFLGALLRIPGDGPFLSVIYRVVKPALAAAYRAHLAATDALDDAPTTRVLRIAREEEEEQMARMEPVIALVLQDDAEREAAEQWGSAARAGLESIGGLARGAGQLPPDSPLLALPPYMRPEKCVRDPRFAPATVHMPRHAPEISMRYRRVLQGINHLNEMWAAEAVGVVAAELGGMPWEFYLDAARWAYDESRHSAMGEERLTAWGYRVGVDVPCVGDHYNAVSDASPTDLLALLHGFETNGPKYKAWLKGECEADNDLVSAQDCDFDWADEALHLTYGLKWLRHLLGGKTATPADIDSTWRAVMSRWEEWINGRWSENPNQYALFTPRIEALMAAGKPA
jgi:uncharacterized ferritin-like protein (DUF455 family)